MYVLHCASIVWVRVEANPQVHAVNVDGTANIIDQCVRHRVRKLVYISSTGAIPERPAGEKITAEIIAALSDPAITKWAFNATFERVCLSRHLGVYLRPEGWRCSMVWAATLGLPLSLEGVGAVLGLEKQKLQEGKELVLRWT